MRNWADLAATMLARSTQTNEPARCATLLPVLAALSQPSASLEVGTSAGLCLYPDAYQYRYDGHTVGRPDSPVQIDCAVSGDVPLPIRVPVVVWRAGIDLNPLNAADAWMPGDVPTGVVNVVILEVALRGCSRWFM